ncbi:MAG TPA: hypothetical protein VGZ29_05500 [Terriglobia bacterium]|nr:hypothetical protein [Terriglobia bacterium]
MPGKALVTVSRRRFLEVAACAVPGALASGHWTGYRPPAPAAGPACALVDLGTDCVLPESRSGFARALAMANVPFLPSPVERIAELVLSADSSRHNVILIPGGVLRSPDVAGALRRLTDRGATVVYESGAAYTDAGGFASERNLLQRYFGIRLEAPVELWNLEASLESFPYVHYDWPERLAVRDFSRVLPVLSPQRAFATLDRMAVAERVRLGAGEFIFLGSPLGSHLGLGDREALALMKAFVSAS